jgi:hypothetical protein
MIHSLTFLMPVMAFRFFNNMLFLEGVKNCEMLSKIRWTNHIPCIGEDRNTCIYNILSRKKILENTVGISYTYMDK